MIHFWRYSYVEFRGIFFSSVLLQTPFGGATISNDETFVHHLITFQYPHVFIFYLFSKGIIGGESNRSNSLEITRCSDQMNTK